MNIADIDLDIFIDQVCSVDQRPRAPSTIRPWNEEQLRRFLEDQCRLRCDPSSRRPKGRFVVHHDEAFPVLGALSENGAIPLTLTHIDAHSDLGTGFGVRALTKVGGLSGEKAEEWGDIRYTWPVSPHCIDAKP